MNFFQTRINADKLEPYISATGFDGEVPETFGKGGVLAYSLRDNSICAFLRCNPLCGGDGRTEVALRDLLGLEYPAGTILSFTNFGSPYLDGAVNGYIASRDKYLQQHAGNASETIKLAVEAIQDRGRFIASGGQKKLSHNTAAILSSLIYVSIKVPLKLKDPTREENWDKYEAEKEEFLSLLSDVFGKGDIAGLNFRLATEAEYKAAICRYFDPYGEWHNDVEENEVFYKQIMPVGSSMSWGKRHHNTIHFRGFNKDRKENYVAMLAINTYPTGKYGFSWASMMSMLGQSDGTGVQIGMPYAMTTVIHYPEQSSARAKLQTGQVIADKQKGSPMERFSPRASIRNQGFRNMQQALLDGSKVVEVTTTLMLFNRSKRELSAACARLESYYRSMGMNMGRERFVPEVSFFNSLPGNASPESIKGTDRFKRLTSSMAAHLLPVMDEWQGYGTDILYTTRLGRLFQYSLFNPNNNNYSCVFMAESGAGKSFNMNRFIADHLSIDTKITVIDRGRSMAGLGIVLGAQMIDFHPKSEISLNPFTRIVNPSEELGIIMPIFYKMVSENGMVSDEEAAILAQAAISVFNKKGNQAEVQDVINYLANQDDSEVAKRLATLMFHFGDMGSYGRWFKGANTYESTKQFTILELQDLDGTPHLMKVVLMALSISVSQEMYRNIDNRKKLLVVEEAGALMGDAGFASFMDSMVSKIRKEVGGVAFVVQNINQMYQAADGKYGRSIMSSVGTKFIFQQRPDALTQALSSKQLELSPYQEHLIRSCRTVKNQYSECVIITKSGTGIARLVESPLNRVLFSTEGEHFLHIKRMAQDGSSSREMMDYVRDVADRLYGND